MGENSKIEWCHHTVNIWWGCYEVHAGCDHCYAKTLANRYHGPNLLWQQQGPRMHIKSAFNDLLRYQKQAEKENRGFRVFINSMSDLFEKSMPVIDNKHQLMIDKGGYPVYTNDLRMQFFDIVERCPNLIFLCLTKRPSNIKKMIPLRWLSNIPANIMFGTSVVNQETADTLIPQLLDAPGKKFLSMEPLIGSVDLCAAIRIWQHKEHNSFHTPFFGDLVHWVIVGGESGHGARVMMPHWLKTIRSQCLNAEVPFFMKQDSAATNKNYHDLETLPVEFRIRDYPIYHSEIIPA